MTSSLGNASFIKESQPFVHLKDTDLKSLLNHFAKKKITLSELVDRILFYDEQTLQEQSKELDILFDSVTDEDVDVYTQASACELIESRNPVRMKFGIWVLSKRIQTHRDKKTLNYLCKKIEGVPSAERGDYSFLSSTIKTSFFLALDLNHYEKAIHCLNNLHLLPVSANMDLEMPKLVLRLLQVIESEQDASKQKNARDMFGTHLSAFYLKWQAQTYLYLQIASLLFKKEYGKVKGFQKNLFKTIVMNYSEKEKSLVGNMFIAHYVRLFLNIDFAVISKNKILKDWFKPNKERLINYFKNSKDILLCTQWAHFLIDSPYEKMGWEKVFSIVRDGKYESDQETKLSLHAYLVCLHSQKKILLKDHLNVILAFIKKEDPKEAKVQIKYWTDELMALEKGEWSNHKPLLLQWLNTFPKVLENDYEQGFKLLKHLKYHFKNESEFFDQQVYQVNYWIRRNDFKQALSVAQEWGIVWKVSKDILGIIKPNDTTQLSEEVITFLKENLSQLTSEEIVNFYPILASAGQENMIKCAEVVLALKSLHKIKFVIPQGKAQQIIKCFNRGFEENWKKVILDYKEIIPYLLSQVGGFKAPESAELLMKIWKALYEKGSAKEISAFNQLLLPLDINISPSQSEGLLKSHFKGSITNLLKKMLFIIQLLSHASATIHDKDLLKKIVDVSKSLMSCEFEKKHEIRLFAILSFLSQSADKERIRVHIVTQIYALFQLNPQFRSKLFRTMLNKSMEAYLASREPIVGKALLSNIIQKMEKKSTEKTALTFHSLWQFMNCDWIKENLTLEEKGTLFKEVILCTLRQLNPPDFDKIYVERDKRKDEINLYSELLENIVNNLNIVFPKGCCMVAVFNFATLVFFLEKFKTDEEFHLIMNEIISFFEIRADENFLGIFGEYAVDYFLNSLRYHFLEAPLEMQYVESFFGKMFEYATSNLSIPMLISLRSLLRTREKYLYGVHLNGKCIRQFSEKYLTIPKMLPNTVSEDIKSEFINEWEEYAPVIPDVSFQEKITLDLMRQWYEYYESKNDEALEFCTNEYIYKILESKSISPQKMAQLNYHVLKYFHACLEHIPNAVNYPFKVIFGFLSAICQTSNTMLEKGGPFEDEILKYSVYIVRRAQNICLYYMKNIRRLTLDTDSLLSFADSLFTLTKLVKTFPGVEGKIDEYRKHLHLLYYSVIMLTGGIAITKETVFMEKLSYYIKGLEQDYPLLSKDEVDQIFQSISISIQDSCLCNICNQLRSIQNKLKEIVITFS